MRKEVKAFEFYCDKCGTCATVWRDDPPDNWSVLRAPGPRVADLCAKCATEVMNLLLVQPR